MFGEFLVGFHASVTVIRLTDIHAYGGLFCKTHTVGVVIFIPYGSSVFHFGICDGIGTFPGKLPCVELHFAPCFREKEIHVMRPGNRYGTVDGYFCGLRCGEVEGGHGFGFYVVQTDFQRAFPLQVCRELFDALRAEHDTFYHGPTSGLWDSDTGIARFPVAFGTHSGCRAQVFRLLEDERVYTFGRELHNAGRRSRHGIDALRAFHYGTSVHGYATVTSVDGHLLFQSLRVVKKVISITEFLQV